MTEPMALVAKDLSLKIGQQQILADISLSLCAGKVMGVLGPNGAGKTTLLKMLSAQLPSNKGVTWKGKVLSDYQPMQLARQIAVVNQHNESVFNLTLYQIVRMGLLPHQSLLARHTPADEQEIQEGLLRVGLEDKAQQGFHSLSGGEQQRGLIARALVQKASLVVLDEPVNHLDVYYQHQVLGLLRALAHKLNITVVMSLHDLSLAGSYCDHLCLLDKGKISKQGSVRDVLEAKRLEQVFHLPCQVRHELLNGAVRVDFYPPNEVEVQSTPTHEDKHHD